MSSIEISICRYFDSEKLPLEQNRVHCEIMVELDEILQ